MQYKKTAAQFCIGGSAYVGLELVWRGRSHISMFGAGGLCYLLLGKLEKTALPPFLRSIAGAGIITAVELGTGLAVNRDHHVWDYRGLPGNFRGQICPAFMALWAPLSLAGMVLYRRTERLLDIL